MIGAGLVERSNNLVSGGQRFKIWNAAGDAYLEIDSGDDAVAANKGLNFYAAADEDIELINLSVTGTPRLYWNETDSLFQSTVGWKATVFEATSYFHINSATGIVYFGTGTDGALVTLKSRDNGVGWVDVGVVYSAADPYILIGRDDTGVATNAITDGLVLRMGAGTNNEAAGHGFGISVMLGNAASEVEERASLDFALVTATDGAEATRLDVNLMNAGAMMVALSLAPAGATGAQLSSSGSIALLPSGDTDDFFTFATVSNIPTIYGTGAYVRIGDAGTPSLMTTNEDGLYVSGDFEVKSSCYLTIARISNYFNLADDKTLRFGNSDDVYMLWETADANANALHLELPTASSPNVPALLICDVSIDNVDLGLFDGITQPTIAVIEKSALYASDTAMTAAGAGATMTKTNEFTNSVVGDIVRVTAGTNATAGWYYITTVTDASNVDLDRNWCTGAVTDGAAVLYHDFTMLSADGICTRITDGAPSDASVEIDRDGWLILDVGQANGRLYWRANNGWHYVDATAGLSLPASERIDPLGHKFEVGDEVKLIVDRINDDGSFHAIPHFRG